MDQIIVFTGICGGLVVLFLLYKLTVGKKKRFAKPQAVQGKVEYDKRYPKRQKILNKEYNLEDTKPSNPAED